MRRALHAAKSFLIKANGEKFRRGSEPFGSYPILSTLAGFDATDDSVASLGRYGRLNCSFGLHHLRNNV